MPSQNPLPETHAVPDTADALRHLRPAAPAAPERQVMLEALAQRAAQEKSKMNWLSRTLHGRPRLVQAGAAAALLLLLLAGSLLLPFARGLRHAPQAIADEGGFVLELALPAGANEPSPGLAAAAAEGERRANAARQRRGQPALSVATALAHDEQGRAVAQVCLAGGDGAEAADLAATLGAEDTTNSVRVIAIAPGNNDAITVVRPLDDPANPYRDEYSAVDRWIYAHAWSFDEFLAFRAEVIAAQEASGLKVSMAPVKRFMAARIDKDGWMRPVAQQMDTGEPPLPADLSLYERDMAERRRSAERIAARKQVPVTTSQGSWIYTGHGNDKLYQDYLNETQLYGLARTPRVPQWLVQGTLPFMAVLVPNGEVVTYGKPGEDHPVEAHPGASDNAEGRYHFPSLGWYRFAADGRLLEQSPGINVADAWDSDLNNWTRFYWPEAEAVTGDTGKHSYSSSRHGGSYWVKLSPKPAGKTSIAEHASRTPVAAYAYDGAPLDLQAPVPPELLARRVLMGLELRLMYDAQQEHGVWYGQPADEAGAQ